MEEKLVILHQKVLVILILSFFSISSQLVLASDCEDIYSVDEINYNDSSSSSSSLKKTSSLLVNYSYYKGIEFSFIVSPGLRLSYIHPIYYNTFMDVGGYLPLSNSSSSYLGLTSGARYSFNLTEFYSLQLGSSLGLRYKKKDNRSNLGIYIIPRLVSLFTVNSSLIFNVELFTNINLYRSSSDLTSSIKANLGLGFIYKL